MTKEEAEKLSNEELVDEFSSEGWVIGEYGQSDDYEKLRKEILRRMKNA